MQTSTEISRNYSRLFSERALPLLSVSRFSKGRGGERSTSSSLKDQHVNACNCCRIPTTLSRVLAMLLFKQDTPDDSENVKSSLVVTEKNERRHHPMTLRSFLMPM